MNIIYLI
jgi:hypothetical protein